MKLLGKTLAITRSEQDAGEFIQLVKSEGGKTIALHTIEIVPASSTVIGEFLAATNEKKHDYCAFMSAQAVRVMFDLADNIKRKDQVVSVLNEMSVVAVGPKTMEVLKNQGVKVMAVPEKFSSIGLVEFFSKHSGMKDKQIIIPRSSASNEFAADSLSAIGMKVDEIFLYDVKTADPNDSWKNFHRLLSNGKVDAIVFTSASNVVSFFEILNMISAKKISDKLPAAFSIGPFTSKELKKRNINYFEAKDHTIKGTFELALQILSKKAKKS